VTIKNLKTLLYPRGGCDTWLDQIPETEKAVRAFKTAPSMEWRIWALHKLHEKIELPFRVIVKEAKPFIETTVREFCSIGAVLEDLFFSVDHGLFWDNEQKDFYKALLWLVREIQVMDVTKAPYAALYATLQFGLALQIGASQEILSSVYCASSAWSMIKEKSPVIPLRQDTAVIIQSMKFRL